ncbi:MAG: UpxY family transcription antiterminator [Parabacteroides sp.]
MSSDALPDGDTTSNQWFVLRDLKRANAALPAYLLLEQVGIRQFTPMCQRLVVHAGKKERRIVPVMQDLVFAYSTVEKLNPIIERTRTLQYRYQRGAAYCDPMTVPDAIMEQFIQAVTTLKQPQYYTPEEITPAMYGKVVRVIGGTMDGYEGHLLSKKGMRTKRLLIEIPNLITVAVQIQPEYIQLVDGLNV